jgi:hypothetical protein
MTRSKVRPRLEAIVALCAGILGILTIFWHDWIEALTGQGFVKVGVTECD